MSARLVNPNALPSSALPATDTLNDFIGILFVAMIALHVCRLQARELTALCFAFVEWNILQSSTYVDLPFLSVAAVRIWRAGTTKD